MYAWIYLIKQRRRSSDIRESVINTRRFVQLTRYIFIASYNLFTVSTFSITFKSPEEHPATKILKSDLFCVHFMTGILSLRLA